METCISRRQNTVAQFIATSPILDLCLEAERRPVEWVVKKWWEKDGINLVGIQEEALTGMLEEVVVPHTSSPLMWLPGLLRCY